MFFTGKRNLCKKIILVKGLISYYLIAVHVKTINYYESVPLCTEMEVYYKETNNYKRLMHVYNYLSDYYFLINAHDVAKNYFNKALEIINSDKSLERFEYIVYYNWGIRCFREYRLEEALENFMTSLNLCVDKKEKLPIIIYLLIIMTKQKCSDEDIQLVYKEGEKVFNFGIEGNQTIFKYFRFKLRNNKYYRKHAFEKILPMLSDERKSELLLFFYEDLYK